VSWPVPTGFAADSVTFVSTQEAFALGTAPGAGASIVRTLDRGATWGALPAPPAPIGQPGRGAGSQAWGIRFATPSHGFVFGRGLWVTTDGGEHWARIAYPGGQILSLATIDGQVLALIAPSSSAPFNRNAVTETLYRRPLGGGAWRQVTRVQAPWILDPTDLIATQAGVAAVLDASSVVVTANGGLTYARRALPHLPSAIYRPALVTATGEGGLALLLVGQGYTGHMDKAVYMSADLGAHWTRAGTPPSVGDPYAIASGTPADLVISTSSAASWLVRSGDSGTSWITVTMESDGGVGWADLGFTSRGNGVVIHGPALSDGNSEGLPGQLFLTSDGGSTWYQVRF
jgi:photosystem II stability/assembly factor-like uncharacterized protein